MPTNVWIYKLDKLRFHDFLCDIYKEDYPDSPEETIRLVQNMNLTTDSGVLNLAACFSLWEVLPWITHNPNQLLKN